MRPRSSQGRKINKMYHHYTRDIIQNLFSNPDHRKGRHAPNAVFIKVPLMFTFYFRLLCKFIVRTGAPPRRPQHEWGHHKHTNTHDSCKRRKSECITRYTKRILKSCSRIKPGLRLRRHRFPHRVTVRHNNCSPP
jgi:hypothetical protein